MFHDPTDPRQLTPEQRLDELTALLATGLRRVLALRPSAVPDSPQIPLDVSPEKSVHASRPVNATGDEARS
jgi:hypothetical protein